MITPDRSVFAATGASRRCARSESDACAPTAGSPDTSHPAFEKGLGRLGDPENQPDRADDRCYHTHLPFQYRGGSKPAAPPRRSNFVQSNRSKDMAHSVPGWGDFRRKILRILQGGPKGLKLLLLRVVLGVVFALVCHGGAFEYRCHWVRFRIRFRIPDTISYWSGSLFRTPPRASSIHTRAFGNGASPGSFPAVSPHPSLRRSCPSWLGGL